MYSPRIDKRYRVCVSRGSLPGEDDEIKLSGRYERSKLYFPFAAYLEKEKKKKSQPGTR